MRRVKRFWTGATGLSRSSVEVHLVKFTKVSIVENWGLRQFVRKLGIQNFQLFEFILNTSLIVFLCLLCTVEKKKNGDHLAAKVEKAVKMQRHIMLFWESKLIHKLRGKTFVPFLHFVGDEKTEDGKMYHVMVMDLLGKSLEDLFQECRRKFDLKTVLHISIQMVSLN